jgi:hypothetical protein
MTLAELLSIPFIRGAESVSDESGAWSRRFEYPEIRGCVIEAETALNGLRALELLRVARLLRAIGTGQAIPCPRPPLRSLDVAGQLRDFGLDIPPDLLELDERRAATDARIPALVDEATRMAEQLAAQPTPA